MLAWENGRSRTSSAEYRRWRETVLRRDRFACQLGLPGCTRRATEADHIVPVAEGGTLLDTCNGQATCASCHKTKTQAESLRGRRRRSRLRPPPRHPGLA
ncbi:HNH endonuclease [Actinomyces bowdenii]|uniref:HNH endonuclease n=1 Tax=Actinomyces bowdenii TaxID=131109 RepID=UPI0035A2A072